MFLLSLYNDCIALLPELFLCISISVILIYLVIYSTSFFLDFPLLISNVSWLCIQILLITLYLNVFNSLCNITVFHDLIIVDLFSVVIKTSIILICVFVLLMSMDYNKLEMLNKPEFSIFVILSVLGTLLLVSSYDLLSMYLSIELQSFCSYLLASFKRNSEFSAEAGLKYFVLGAFSSGFLLFGCSLVYGFSGTTNYRLLSLLVVNYNHFSFSGNGIIIGAFFILIAFLFKLSAAPFHIWSADVYEGAPTIVMAFFALIHKLGLFIFFFRLFYDPFYGIIGFWQILIITASIISMLLGSFGAMWQMKLKRLLAFSTIGQVGYMLISLCCNSFESVFALIFYCLVYSVMNISTFSLLLMVRKSSYSKRIKYSEDFVTMAKTNPFLAISLGVTFFSIAGVPPFVGFFSKMFLFFGSISQSMFNLTIIGVLTSVVSCFYYLRIVQMGFFEKINKWISLKRVNKELAYLASLSNLFIILFFFHPNLFVLLIHYSIFDLCL